MPLTDSLSELGLLADEWHEFAAFDQGGGDYPIDPPVVDEVGQTALGSAIGAGEERLGPIPPSAGSRTWPENSTDTVLRSSS
jgi:hypothetical protein